MMRIRAPCARTVTVLPPIENVRLCLVALLMRNCVNESNGIAWCSRRIALSRSVTLNGKMRTGSVVDGGGAPPALAAIDIAASAETARAAARVGRRTESRDFGV